jgi:EpsI family protein
LSLLPLQLGAWTGEEIDIDQETRDVLGAGEFLLRDYDNRTSPQPPIGLLLVYFPTQRTGDTIHSPSHCLPGSGWVPTERAEIQIARPDGTTFPANRYVVSKRGDRELVVYWFQAHNRGVASEYRYKYYLIADAIRMNRSDGGLVRLMTPMFRGESTADAEKRLLAFNANLLPVLDNYIPR